MNNKTLLLILAVVVGLIIVLSVKTMSVPNSKGETATGTAEVNLVTQPNPPSIGQTTFIIAVKDTNGKAVDNAKVSFDLNMTTMNMGLQQGNATSQGNGKYAATGRLSMRGPWRVSTTVTMPDGTKVNKDFTVNAQ
ncbi:hypothetical protein BH11PAT1_BH11PAT1_5140 [soil metagenome]